MRVVILLFVCLLVFQGFLYGLTFTEEFDNEDYIQTRSMVLTGGNAMIGYPDVYVDRYWYNEWGNFGYYGGYFYVVWSDVRYDGQNQVFLTKIDTLGNVVFSTNIEVSILGATNTYYDFALRPTISVYDANNIYVTFLQFKNGKYYSYTTKWQDVGTSLNLVWGKRVDNGFGDNISYTPIPFKFSSTVDSSGNLYLLQIWNRVGSGETSWISKILPDGTQYWLSVGYPGTQYLTTFNSGTFIIAGEVLYSDGYIYVSGQHWIWSPSRDFGVGVNKISTNNTYSSLWGSGTNITTDRGTIYNYTRNFAPRVSMAILNGYLYVVFSDQRNGSMDVFISRVSTNDGSRDWTKLIAGGSFNEEYPTISYDSVGNIYVSYVDWGNGIPMLKLSKVDKDTGNVLGTMTFESALYPTTSGFYLPKFFVDTSGSIYIFFVENGGLGKLRLKVAKYDSFGGNLVWIREFPEIQYKKYSHVFSRKLLSDLVGTPVSIKLSSSFSGNPTFKVSPNGGINYYDTPTNTLVTFTNLGNDLRVRIEANGDGSELVVISNYTLEVVDFYTGDLFSSTNSSFSSTIGSNFISVYPSSQIIANNTFSDGINKAVFYVRLNNIGTTNGNFYLYLTPSGWGVSVFDWDNNNVTVSFTNGTYSINMGSNVFTNFRVEVTIPSSAYDGEYQDFVLYSSAVKGGFLHDSLTLRATSWKYLPDAFISNSYTILGKGYWEISPDNQVLTNTVNSRFYNYESKVTNYIVVTNSGILQDVVEITNLFNVNIGDVSDWNINVYNLSDAQDVSSYPYYLYLNTGQSKVIRVVVSPKTNAPVGAYLTMNFYFSSTNSSASTDNNRKDSIRFVFENHKYQPDLIISTNSYFLNSVGEGDYLSTNLSVTQSIMVRTVNEQSVTYYFKLRNDGLESSTILLKSSGITNSDWDEKYYHNLNDITTSLTNGTNITLGAGEEFVFRGVFKPGSTVDSGIEPWVKISATITNFTNSYDVVYARPRNIKVRPDVIVGYDLSSATNGNDVYNSTGSGQHITNVLLKGGTEIATNIVIVQNDSTTDPDIINIVGDPQNSKWFVKYLDVNNNDITHNITNTTNLTLPLGSSVTLKVVSYPLSSANDDEWIGIKVRAYSSYVYSQEDVVFVSNIAITVKPDLGVFSPFTGWIDLPNISSTYEEQGSLSNKIIAGKTNIVKIKLKNDTGSIQSYVFKASASSIGGSLSDWNYVFKSVISGFTNDITTFVTNSGWTNVYISNEQVEVVVYVSLTNDVDYNVGTTNGAVSNTFSLKYEFISTFRSNVVDRGMHSFIVVRGMPDVYHESAYRGLGVVTNEFYSDNYMLYGITKNYPRDDIILKFKNSGDWGDMFRTFVIVSNGSQPGNHITNWIFKFFDQNTNDITSYLTNTNSGWTNLINPGYEKIVRLEIVNSNGFVNDNVFFYFYFESITKEKRTDVLWFESIITPGLPDVSVSNMITGVIKGTNQFAPDSSDYQKLETNEIGKFKIIMRNIAPIEGYPAFKLKASFYGDVGKFDIYHTNKSGDYLDNSILTTTGYTNNISNYNSANGWPEDYLTLYVVPKSSAVPGDKIIIRYDFSLYDNPGVYDYIFVTNQFVAPRVTVLSIPSYSTNVDVYVGKYQSIFGNIIVSNGDNVWEQFVVKANQSNPSGWNVTFYTNSTDISSDVFGSGFTTNPIDRNGVFLLSVKITNTSELISGNTNILEVQAISRKNTNVISKLKMNIVYVDAIADIFVRGNDIDNNDLVGNGIVDGVITNKIELNETNVYIVYLSNSINSGGDVRFVISVESNYSPEFITKILDQSDNDITSQVFNSNYIISLPSSGSRFIKVYRVLTNTNSTVTSGFHSYLRISMNTYDVQNNIYDYITLRDVVVYPNVDVRSASGFDNIFSFSSYSDSGKNLKTFKNVATTVYLGVMNTDVVREKFYVKASGGNSTWEVKYYDLNNNDITENIVNGSYVTPYIENSSYYIIKTVIKPSIDVNPADVFEQFVEVWSYKNNTRKDYITNKVSIESMFIVGSVKDRKTKKGIPKPIVEVVDPYGLRVKVSGDDNGNYAAPVYPVIGGLYKIKVDAQGYVGTFTNIYFELGTNTINFELVGVNMSSDKLDVRIFPNPVESGKGGSFVYALNEPSKVSVSIYDLKGKLIKHLVKDEYRDRGVYYVIWDGTDENGSYVKQGVYVFVINDGKQVVVKKLLIK